MLRLTPEVLVTAYDYLCATEPFCRWNMPDSEEIEFRVVKDPALRGWYCVEGKKHTIGISANTIGRTHSLMRTMAHEMVHLHQRETNMETPNAQHNKAFVKLAAKVCVCHGFDSKLF